MWSQSYVWTKFVIKTQYSKVFEPEYLLYPKQINKDGDMFKALTQQQLNLTYPKLG